MLGGVFLLWKYFFPVVSELQGFKFAELAQRFRDCKIGFVNFNSFSNSRDYKLRSGNRWQCLFGKSLSESHSLLLSALLLSPLGSKWQDRNLRE